MNISVRYVESTTDPGTPYQNTYPFRSTSEDYESYDYDYLYGVIQQMVYPQLYEWFLIAAYAIVLIAALAGNTLVCLAILKNEHMRTVTNYYIVNLGFADILVSLLCLPITVVVDVSETWFFGATACKLIPYFQVRQTDYSVIHNILFSQLICTFNKKSDTHLRYLCLSTT